MQRLLERQIRKARAPDGSFCIDALIRLVDVTYAEYEADRNRLERASRLMSEELGEQNLELERRRVEAEQANAAKSQFLANMSHEIRTPLNGVIALADALSSTDLSAGQRDMVMLVRTSGITLERLLTDILDLSKIEAGKLEINMEAFDLRESIETAAHVFRTVADEKGIAFRVEYHGDVAGRFVGDAVRIRQVVTNLAANAVKFTSSGSVTVRVSSEDSPDAGQPSTVTIAVTDTGVGFDEETGRRLFGRFEQADSSITRTFGGTGLGLSISRSLCRAMGGDVSAVSTPGRGSSFTVFLPLMRSRAATPDHDKRAGAQAVQELTDVRMLVVEDNAMNRRVVQFLLAKTGANLTFAEDGAKGVEAFQSSRFDVVLMDMQMPVMDGLTATRCLRAWEAQSAVAPTPVIILSANVMEEQVRQSIEAAADLHIAKPFTLDSLLAGLRTVLQ